MNLSQHDWSKELKNDINATIIDVRTYDEWQIGIIPNAKKIDVNLTNSFVSQIDFLDKGLYNLWVLHQTQHRA